MIKFKIKYHIDIVDDNDKLIFGSGIDYSETSVNKLEALECLFFAQRMIMESDEIASLPSFDDMEVS